MQQVVVVVEEEKEEKEEEEEEEEEVRINNIRSKYIHRVSTKRRVH